MPRPLAPQLTGMSGGERHDLRLHNTSQNRNRHKPPKLSFPQWLSKYASNVLLNLDPITVFDLFSLFVECSRSLNDYALSYNTLP